MNNRERPQDLRDECPVEKPESLDESGTRPANGARFDDPTAKRTEWTPMTSKEAGFRTQELVEVTPDRLEFRMTSQMRLLTCSLMLLGLVLTCLGLVAAIGSWASEAAPALLLCGLGFGGSGIFVHTLEVPPRVFDLKSRRFWIGEEPEKGANASHRHVAVPLAQIKAIQLLGKVSTGDEHFDCYELNLVLKNAGRLHVVCHGDQAGIFADAQRVASHIDVPVWDARI